MLPWTFVSSVGGVQIPRRSLLPRVALKGPLGLWPSGVCPFATSAPHHFRPPIVVAAAPAGQSHGGATLGLSGSGRLVPGQAVSVGGGRGDAVSTPSTAAAISGHSSIGSSGNCSSNHSSSEAGGGGNRGQVRGTALRTVDPVIAAASATRALSATPRSAKAASASAPSATASVLRDPGTYSSVDSMDDGGSGGVRLLVVVGVVLLDDPHWTQAAATAAAAADEGTTAPLAAGAEAVAAAAVAAAAAASGTELGPDRSSGCSSRGAVDMPVRVLLAQRPEGKSNAGLWEFPGGKVDPGETPEEALIRELQEELGIAVDPADLVPLTFASHTYPTFHLLMPLYVCRRWLGEPLGAEGQAVAWATPEEVASYNLTPADIPLVPAVLAAMRYGTQRL
ncbi:hypothetical protein Vretimale_13671 [Volvox reticuliferus]|uniref:8-oxo-dGTP diphosphatase n=2 Tax=Volvox reticuliferus TaxID=1737510 RepID=A0A8J4GLW6_9CHLO|nr:hypothetical protein Vretimale_13671 [Volvox reticuliferus]